MVVVGTHVQFSVEDTVRGEATMWVGTFDGDGVLQWSASAFPAHQSTGANLPGAHGVHIDQAGRILVVGDKDDGREDGTTSGFLRIYDSDGTLIQSVIDESVHIGLWRDVATDGQDNSVVIGLEMASPGGWYHPTVRVIAADGIETYAATFIGMDGPGGVGYRDVRGLGALENRIVLAGTNSGSIRTIALTNRGDVLWQSDYDSATDLERYGASGQAAVNELALDERARAVVVGSHRVAKPVGSHTWYVNEPWAGLYADDGRIEWIWWRDSAELVPGSAVAVTFDGCGEIVLVGTAREVGLTDVEDEVFLVKLDSSGTLLWETRSLKSDWRGARALAPTPDGGIVLLGTDGISHIDFNKFSR